MAKSNLQVAVDVIKAAVAAAEADRAFLALRPAFAAGDHVQYGTSFLERAKGDFPTKKSKHCLVRIVAASGALGEIQTSPGAAIFNNEFRRLSCSAAV